MALSVEVDKDICISSGRCVADAPSAFQFDEDEVAEVIPDGSTVDDARLVEIARGCPSGAISLRDGAELVDLD